jgi:hypothetical protein
MADKDRFGGSSKSYSTPTKKKSSAKKRREKLARLAKNAEKQKQIDLAKKKKSIGPAAKSPFKKASDDLLMDLGLKAKDVDYYYRLSDRSAASQKALEDMKARRKKKGGSSSTSTDTDTDTSTNTTTTTTTTNTDTDTNTFEGGTVGGTSVTAESIYTRDPEDAISDQEKLAAEELRRQRIKRAREKQSLLRRRIERTAEVGSGRRVLSGTERELNVQSRQAGSGRRGGAGRRSLITGSTGGIGYYSRFL